MNTQPTENLLTQLSLLLAKWCCICCLYHIILDDKLRRQLNINHYQITQGGGFQGLIGNREMFPIKAASAIGLGHTRLLFNHDCFPVNNSYRETFLPQTMQYLFVTYNYQPQLHTANSYNHSSLYSSPHTQLNDYQFFISHETFFSKFVRRTHVVALLYFLLCLHCSKYLQLLKASVSHSLMKQSHSDHTHAKQQVCMA